MLWGSTCSTYDRKKMQKLQSALNQTERLAQQAAGNKHDIELQHSQKILGLRLRQICDFDTNAGVDAYDV